MFVCAGAFLFAFGFFLFLTAIQLGGVRFDPSLLSFYPLMAVIAVIFGFERWSYESGGVNRSTMGSGLDSFLNWI